MDKEQVEAYLEKNPFEQLSNIVYNIIEDEITTLKLRPGTKLNISKISEDLNVSRTPVREALIKLNELGFVKKLPEKQGFYVSELSTTDIMKTYFIREIIESKAAFLCAAQHEFPHLTELQKLAKDFKNTILKDRETVTDLDYKFHELIVLSCGNEYLINFFNSMQKKIKRLIQTNMTIITENNHKQIANRLIAEHNAIINCIKANMPEMAEKEMINHINTSTNNSLLFSNVIFNLNKL